MDLMDLALKNRDFEWAKELVKQSEQAESLDKASHENTSDQIYTQSDVALEDIFNTYAVKENAGIRSFNINSEYDRNNSELILIEKTEYQKGELVKYRIPTKDELTYIRGMVTGYLMGYGDANKAISRQMAQFYNSIAAQLPKAQGSVESKQKKVQKKKEVG